MIDIVVPFHSKDKELLPWCIEGIKKYLDFSRILIVCHRDCKPDVERVGGIFIDEESVVKGLSIKSFSNPRWGWYFQQIIKLAAADIVETDYYLVVDSDTVFLKPVSFFNDKGKPLYAPASEYHKAYFEVFRQVLGFHAQREYSFTAHHMVYNKHIVKEMRDRFHPDKVWYNNIIKYLEPQPLWQSISQFNEQETYGHYIKAVHPEEVNLRPLKFSNITAIPDAAMLQKLAKSYHFCSFHAWARG
ncbi:MAG: hypothetical protein H8D67_14370 [Deltaproteobacteria bacterium]|nr:hypothetical protein [Deltaproteobacteria bacterium]